MEVGKILFTDSMSVEGLKVIFFRQKCKVENALAFKEASLSLTDSTDVHR
jgi:hypothetical protein